jgi:mono/diheme cytochrome c family protein
MTGRRLIALAVALLAAIAVTLAPKSRLPAAERGRRLAERTGCFACHGMGGLQGASNPGRKDKTVPGFQGDVMMYADDPDEIRQWIEDGATLKRAKSQTWKEERKRGALKMPAFERRLGPRQIDDLVAYVAAVSGTPEPEDSLAVRGLERAEALGCVGCHGAGGRLAGPNPGSFNGYVPSWDGADFPELVSGRSEFEEWVERGVSRRFEKNAIASWFLRRAVLHMPAYRDRLAPGDLDALWAYVEWLRSADTPGKR